MLTCSISHRFQEGTDLDVHFQGLQDDWESSGFKSSNALQLVRTIKQCFKQMLQVSPPPSPPPNPACTSQLQFPGFHAVFGRAYVLAASSRCV